MARVGVEIDVDGVFGRGDPSPTVWEFILRVEVEIAGVIRSRSNRCSIFAGWCRYIARFRDNHFHFVLYGRGKSVEKRCYLACSEIH